MATILKLTSARTGKTTFKAVIKRRGEILKTRTFKTKAFARAWVQRVEGDRDLLDAFGADGATMTLATLIEAYRQQRPCDSSRQTHLAWWNTRVGAIRLLDLTPRQIDAALDEFAAGCALRNDGNRSKGGGKRVSTQRRRAPATVNRLRSTLSSLYKFAAEQHYVPRTLNPVLNVRYRPERNARQRYLSAEELAALLTACERSAWPGLHTLVRLAVATGARRGELMGLTWDRMDLQTGCAYLLRTKNGDPRAFVKPPYIRDMPF